MRISDFALPLGLIFVIAVVVWLQGNPNLVIDKETQGGVERSLRKAAKICYICGPVIGLFSAMLLSISFHEENILLFFLPLLIGCLGGFFTGIQFLAYAEILHEMKKDKEKI